MHVLSKAALANNLPMLVAAHRGDHSLLSSVNNVPENSLEAVELAAKNGAEIIEVDIRMTSDGIPILSHDSKWGRETNVGCDTRSGVYDPRLDQGTNPNVADITLSVVQNGEGQQQDPACGSGYVLRDSVSGKLSSRLERPSTLQQLIDDVKDKKIEAVIALDIKDEAAFDASVRAVLANAANLSKSFVDNVLFKFPADKISSEHVINTFNGHTIAKVYYQDWQYLRLIPVYQTAMIGDKRFGESTPADGSDPEKWILQNIDSWYRGYFTANFYGFEIDLKEPGGTLSKAADKARMIGRIHANFQPVPEDINFGRNLYYVDGRCNPCQPLSSFLYTPTSDADKAAGLPSDATDQRESADFLIATNTRGMITTDDYKAMISYLAAKGMRDNLGCLSEGGNCSEPFQTCTDPDGDEAPCAASASESTDPLKKILFVGDSYTFGRVNPVMSFNASNVHDLTTDFYALDQEGTNPWEPHPWGGVPGLFKAMTAEVGLNYDVSISARNAASLRGHFLNLSSPAWDLRGNIGSQKWDAVVLQDQTTMPLPLGKGKNADPLVSQLYAREIALFVSDGSAQSYREADMISHCASATTLSTASCLKVRDIPANPNANQRLSLYVLQTPARPDMVFPHLITKADPSTTDGNPVVDTSSNGGIATKYYDNLCGMTQDMHDGVLAMAASIGDAKPILVGDAFQLAVDTSDAVEKSKFFGDGGAPIPFASHANIDLWWEDGLHASKYGSYLEALMAFGTITKLSPLVLASSDSVAASLGISPERAEILQKIAAAQLARTANPSSDPHGSGPVCQAQ